MIIGEVLGVTFIALAACISLWALLIGIALVFGERAAEAQMRLETRPFPMLAVGVGLALTAGLVGQILVSQPNGMLKLVGWALLLGLLTLSLLGGAGLALIVAGRIRQAAPRLLPRRREQYARLRANGVRECAMAGNGPAAPADAENGPLYHYLRIFVTPDTLTIRPVGVRRLETGGFRREEPMPVFHAGRLPEDRPPWTPRVLDALVVRRGAAPEAHWV